MGLKGFGSTRHGLEANWDPGGGGLHGCALGDSCVFERSQPAQMAAMLAGGLANWVLPKSIVGTGAGDSFALCWLVDPGCFHTHINLESVFFTSDF